MKIINKFLFITSFIIIGLFFGILLNASPEITPWHVGRMAGIFAFVLLTLTICMGLLMTSKILLKIQFFRSPEVLSTHQFTATYLALGFILLHIVSFIYDKALALSWQDILIPFSTKLNFSTIAGINIKTGMALGTFAFYTLLILLVTSRLRKRLIPLKIWRKVHYLSFVFYALFISHAYFTGSDSKELWMQAIYLASLIVVLSLILLRIFGKKYFLQNTTSGTVSGIASRFPLPKRHSALVTKLQYLDNRDLELTFDVKEDFSFLAGQFISLSVGNGLFRSYSIASNPQDIPEIKIVVSVAHNGAGSIYLRSLKEGDTVEFIGPSGRFVLPENLMQNLVFIATGTGIAPLISMMYQLEKDKYTGGITVLFGVRNASELFYHEILKYFETKFEKFNYKICFSQEIPTDNDYKMLLGRVQEVEEVFANPDKQSNYFVCGNPFMVTEVVSLLLDKGVDKGLIAREKFTVSKHKSNTNDK